MSIIGSMEGSLPETQHFRADVKILELNGEEMLTSLALASLILPALNRNSFARERVSVIFV